MKIFDGFEEIEIVPWSECKDCTEHSRFTSQLSALFFLQRFRTYAFAMEPLRRLIRERQPGLSPATVSDQEMLEQAAHLLATGELHATLTPLMREGGRGHSRVHRRQPRPALKLGHHPPLACRIPDLPAPVPTRIPQTPRDALLSFKDDWWPNRECEVKPRSGRSPRRLTWLNQK